MRTVARYLARLLVIAVLFTAHGPWLWLLVPAIALLLVFEVARWLGPVESAGDH